MSAIVDDVLRTARDGLVVEKPEPVSLAAVARAAWATVETDAATLTVETDRTVLADEDYLRRLFENLFRNCMDHGSAGGLTGSDDADAVTVTVGALPDGPGVAEDVRGTLFDSGVSTAAEGTGFGLHIVRSLAAAHGWEVSLAAAHGWEVSLADGGTGADAGAGAPGARFEFRNVSVAVGDDAGGEVERGRRSDGVGR